MYYKVNELNILNRKLTKESNYLTKKEYEAIKSSINVIPEIESLNKILNTYVAPKIQYRNSEEKNWCISAIDIVDDYYYDRNRETCTTIKFRVSILNSNNREVRVYHIEEKGFRKEYITHVNAILKKMYNKTNFMLINRENINHYYYSFTYTFKRDDYLKYLSKIEKEINKIKKILDYYENNLVEIQEDEDYLNDINSIDEFLANLNK